MNISSYPATDVAGSFFFRRAKILNSGGFVQKYSDQGFRAKILVSDSRQVLLCVIQSCAMVN